MAPGKESNVLAQRNVCHIASTPHGATSIPLPVSRLPLASTVGSDCCHLRYSQQPLPVILKWHGAGKVCTVPVQQCWGCPRSPPVNRHERLNYIPYCLAGLGWLESNVHIQGKWQWERSHRTGQRVPRCLHPIGHSLPVVVIGDSPSSYSLSYCSDTWQASMVRHTSSCALLRNKTHVYCTILYLDLCLTASKVQVHILATSSKDNCISCKLS